MASRAPRITPTSSGSSESSEYVRSVEEATSRYLASLTRERSSEGFHAPVSVARMAQQAVGNAATANLLEPRVSRTDGGEVATLDQAEAERRESEDERERDEEDNPLLPDPDDPEPADPAPDGDLESEEPQQDDQPPEHAAASAVDAGVPPAPSSGASSPRSGGGSASAPLVAGGGASALAQAAAQTAANMPAAPGPRSGGARSSSTSATRRVPTRRRIAGPPPVPTVEPDFEGLEDPIKSSTQAIEAIAATRLERQIIPPVPPSPGENTVVVPERAISPPEMRLLELGVNAMDRARLSRTGDDPMPGERAGGETRTRLLGIRDELLGIAPAGPAAGETDASETRTPAPTRGSTRTPPTPRAGAETAEAEELAPGAFTVDPIDLPAPDMTVAEQEMFTAVIANLKAGGEDGSRRILNAIKRDVPDYDNGVLTSDNFGLSDLGQGLLPDIERDRDSRVASMADVLGSAGEMLDSAVADRRSALERSGGERWEDARAAADLDLQTIEETAQNRLNDAAAARAQATEARRRSGAMGSAPNLGFRQVAEAAVRRIQARVSEAIARFRLEKEDRHALLDNARARWLSAADLAILKDQFDAERLHHLTPGAAHPPDIPAAARRAVNRAINRGQDWRAIQVTFIDGEIIRLKEEADRSIGTNIENVQNAGADAFTALREWGNAEDGATEQWWQDQAQQLETWADNATDTANTWAQTETRLARLQMQRAARNARYRIEQDLAENSAELAAYQALTEGEKRNFIARNIMNSDTLIRQIGGPLSEDLIKANEARVRESVMSELFALPRSQWQAQQAAARAKNGTFDAEARGERIRAAGIEKTGTNEAAIFQAMSGLREIERLALTNYYNHVVGKRDNALYEDLDGELSGDEWRRAQALMAGRHGEAAAEAIHDAVFGPGTGEAQIIEALETINGLPEPERTTAIEQADKIYQVRYGESLSTRIGEDMGGSEGRRAIALAAGNMREAEAHQMNFALGERDADAAAAVYERIRSETLEAARRGAWSPSRYEAEVARRNAELSRNFSEQYGNVGNYTWSSEKSTLENAFVANFWYASDAGTRTRLSSLASGDLTGVSAGHMRSEERSTYADDEVMGNIVIDQHRYAADVVELEQGPELRAGMREEMRRWVLSNDTEDSPLSATDIENHRMALERGVNARIADAAFDRARLNVAALDARLVDRYGITLDTMLDNTMSDNVFGDGGDLSNAKERLAIMRRDSNDPGAMADRRIDWAYSRVRHGIEGAGTDMDELRGGLSGLSRAEMRRLDSRWQAEHDDETLRDAIQSDTSGRDEDDLVDLFDHGAPQTVSDQVDELRRRLHRDEESVGAYGAWASMDQSALSHVRLAELEAMETRMRDPSLTPAQRDTLTADFTNQRTSVEAAIETQRTAVDAFAETVTTIISYAIAAVVIAITAILAAVSGGTLSPALVGAIAIAGSLIGTVSGIAAKAAIKGGAYGMEEVGTDLAVGAVDLIVTIATAGLFKGGGRAVFANLRVLMSGAMEEVKVITRQAIANGMRQFGTQALRAGAAQTGRTVVKKAGERAAGSGLRGAAREFALDQMRGVPAILTANVLNEDNWRHGNVAGNILRGTWEGSLQNLRDAAIMGVASHGVSRALGRFVHPQPLTPTQSHERNLRHWRHANFDASPGVYARHVEAYIAANSEYGDIVRSAQREARRSLLSEIPPRERGGVADVPIIHVNETQFRQYNNGNFGDAMVHVNDGQVVIIIRDGAPASSIREIGPQLRDIVAPGTRGRTVNPADSLPPRLRNRVPVEVVRDPSFGADEVRATPLRDVDGNIVGVELQVGPNARAIDIQMHVDTIDAMRRYVGLAGDIRRFMNRRSRRLGMDVADPEMAGLWEAELEIAKLPAIIDERISRLAERGLDPRRRALVMEEIANLERQYLREVERAQMGAAAEERGYVAAKPQGDSDTDVHARPHEAGDGGNAELTPAERAIQIRQIMNDIRSQQASLSVVDQAMWDAQTPGYTEIQNRVRRQKQSYAAALERLSPHLPPDLQAVIRNAGGQWTVTLAGIHADLATRPEFQQALNKLGKADRKRINRVGSYLETIDAFHTERRTLEAQRTSGEERLAELQQQFKAVGGDSFMGVELHPDLPERRAPPGYQPEYAFEPKFKELLGDQLGGELMQAIMDRIELGDADAFNELAARADVQLALGDKTIGKVFEQVVAHRQGYRAELALASRIADGISGLPGDGPHVVIDFGDPIGANEADVISVDAEGNVFLWDSKYRTEGSASRNSETFTDGERRRNAMEDAERILNDSSRTAGLSAEARDRAKLNIAAGIFYAVTSHTNDVFNFTDSKALRVVGGKIQP